MPLLIEGIRLLKGVLTISPLPCFLPQENLQKLVHIEHSVRGQGDLLQPGRVSATAAMGRDRGRPGRQAGEALIRPIVQLGWSQTGLAAGAVYPRRGRGKGRGGFCWAHKAQGLPPLGFSTFRTFKETVPFGFMSLWFFSPLRRRDTKYF